jgi:drug/metabolite transporter (DMT)-like permease
MGRCWADQGVDVIGRERGDHAENITAIGRMAECGRCAPAAETCALFARSRPEAAIHASVALPTVRKPSAVEAMLLTAIGLWSLNLSVTRYILTHGFLPLAYGSVRYGLAALLFAIIGFTAERSLRLSRPDLLRALAAALVLYVNQLGFVYSLRTTSASVIALILAATPIFAALIGLVLRTERLHRGFWTGAALSFGGVALVAAGTGGEVAGDLRGVSLGLLTAATWAVYSILIAPLMRRYSATRISATVIAATWIPLTLTGWGQLDDQSWHLGWTVWLLLVFATLGPLVLTNVLWFRSLEKIGPARATLAANLQPFVAAVLAVVLLGEHPGLPLFLGGALIAVGILIARRPGILFAAAE